MSKEKSQIRQDILEKLKLQKEEQRFSKSLVIKDKLFETPEFKNARMIMFYLASGFEVETRPMITEALKMGKRVAIPVTDIERKRIIASEIEDLDKQLCEGPYGIDQPKTEHIREISIGDIDLIVMPGVAFDRKGNRLGRGAGFYDRFLRDASSQTPRIGLAFDIQIVENVPILSHDIALTRLITN